MPNFFVSYIIKHQISKSLIHLNTIILTKENVFILPNTKRMTVRRQIFNSIFRFDTFFKRSDRCDRTIETPIIHVNHGKTRSAIVKPFQTIMKFIL